MLNHHHITSVAPGSLALCAILLVTDPVHAIVLESWDNQINSPIRFKVLSDFNSEAVLDKESQLVWERSPGDIDRDGDVDLNDTQTWANARVICAHQRTIGGRKGWRLPSFAELASLIDPSVAIPGPLLPPGHPFTNIQQISYWSATTNADSPTAAWGVSLGDGDVAFILKTETRFVWCVRGGMNADQY
ncbi:MAG: DUF1566 domain-containing protein [Nitrospiraceae bacterium]